jgi:hypothetical protein
VNPSRQPVRQPVRQLVRRLARVAALVVMVTVPLVSAPSYAEVPQGWSDPSPVNGLQALLLLAGIPLLLFVVITLLVVAPSLARGERTGPAADEWFGGPGQGAKEIAAGSSESSETGGASGRW